MSNRQKILAAVVLITIGVAGRLLPHMWNAAPIAAVALFAACYLGYRYAAVVTIAAMLIGDFFLGFYSLPMMVSVYGSFLLIGLIGLSVRKDKSLTTVVGASLLSSIVFFLVTNGAVWLLGSMYAPGFAGLMESYAMGLPFFRGTLIGDLSYTLGLFGAFEAVRYLAEERLSRYNWLHEPKPRNTAV